jgi:hypothetical protein
MSRVLNALAASLNHVDFTAALRRLRIPASMACG